jgi:hypothetical protein
MREFATTSTKGGNKLVSPRGKRRGDEHDGIEKQIHPRKNTMKKGTTAAKGSAGHGNMDITRALQEIMGHQKH